MPLVDVIIPTRDRAALTSAAIGSVIGQTFRDWHLYVVDDASDGDSLADLIGRIPEDGRITLVRRQTNGRASAARQTGFDAGDSPWIALLDSDDLWHPQKLEKQLAAAQRHDVILTWHTWLRPDGTSRVTRKPTGGGRVSPLLTNNVDVVLMRRELVDNVGGFVGDESTPTVADENIDFFIRLLGAGNVAVVPEVLAWCRDHVGIRTSDAMTPASLRSILDSRRSLLEAWPDDLGPFLCRLSARYLAVGDRTDGLRFLREGLATGSIRTRVRSAREFGPHAVRATLSSVGRRKRSTK